MRPGLTLPLRSALFISACLLAFLRLAPAQSSDAPAAGPISIGILVDSSAVAGGSSGVVRNAVRTFLRALRPPDEYAIFTSADTFRVAQEFTKDPTLADDPLRQFRPSQAGALYDGIVSAAQYLLGHGKNERKALLVLSSGSDGGSRATLRDAVLAAQQSSLPVFVIALPAEGGRSWNLEQLSAVTNGAAFLPLQQTDLTEVARIAARQVIGPALPPPKSEPAAKPLAGFHELVVRRVPVPASEDISNFQAGDNVDLQKYLVSILAQQKLFPSVTDDSDAPATESLSPHTRLELIGKIVEFRRSGNLKRSTSGLLGSGVGRIRVEFTLRDPATGATILSLEETGSGSSGFFRGNDDTQNLAFRRLANNLVKDLQRNR